MEIQVLWEKVTVGTILLQGGNVRNIYIYNFILCQAKILET